MKDQPYYHLLAENDQSYYIAYVSEQNLVADISGDPVDHRVAVAGIDYLAVDRVGTELMGVDFDTIRYLNFLWDFGFGEADLTRIKIIGESIEACRRPYKMAPRFLKFRRLEAKGMDSDLYEPQ